MAEALTYYPQFANLPEYAGPDLPTNARSIVTGLTRSIVAGLTNLPPEKYIQYVGSNVAASKHQCRVR